MSLAPLDDPAYVPEHPPNDGMVPDVVEKWGAASQVRWFDRFRDVLKPQRVEVWNRFYVSTVYHRGDCCDSCEQDGEHFEEVCCCRGLK